MNCARGRHANFAPECSVCILPLRPLVEHEAAHELEGVDEDLLEVDVVGGASVLVGHLLEGDGLGGEGTQSGPIQRAILRELADELALVSQLEHCAILMEDHMCFFT